MAESHPTNGNGASTGKRRRELALVEIEQLCVNALHDLYILRAGVECILAEVKEARR